MRNRSSLAVFFFAGFLALVGCSAQQHLDRGHAALSTGDPIAARRHFQRALDRDQKLAENPEFLHDFHIARRDAAVAEGHQLLKREQPTPAIERFETALQLQPGWAAAQQGLSLARADAADDALRFALTLADENDLPGARNSLEDALGYVPSHPRAKAALRSLNTPSAHQPATYLQALTLHGESDWDSAIDALQKTISASPDFLPARAALPRFRDDAGNDMIAQGNAALQQQEFDLAESNFLRLADYLPDHPDREAVLARVDLARGDNARSQGLPGQALLDYRRAAAHLTDALDDHHPGLKQSVAFNRLAVIDQLRNTHRLDLSLEPSAPDDLQPGSLMDRLLKQTQSKLAGQKTAALGINLPNAPHQETITLTLEKLDIPQPTVTFTRHEHPYTVREEVINPRLATLSDELKDIDRCLVDLNRREDRLQRRLERLARENPQQPTPPAKETERELDRIEKEIRAAHRDHEKLRAQLNRTPPTVTLARNEYWPYTVEHYARTSNLSVSFTLADLTHESFTAQASDHDDLTLNARPDLDLPEDPLDLAGLGDIENQLIDDVSSQLAEHLVRLLTKRRVNALDEQAHRLANQDPIAAREARVAAALLVRAVSAKLSDQRLRELDRLSP